MIYPCNCDQDFNRLGIEHGTKEWKPSGDYTERGFGYVQFRDAYGQACSAQDSSVVPHLWLGVGCCRMHLSPAQVAGLIGLMARWLADQPLAEQDDDAEEQPR